MGHDREAGASQVGGADAADAFEGSKYRLIRPFGKGAMGDVYEIEHIALARRFVAKVMRQELAGDPRYLERFRLEAQALAALRHRNVVEVTDFGRTASGRPYFVMERLSGAALSAWLKRASAPALPDAIDWIIQTLEGLAAAHAAGIVHRDIKPGNLFLTEMEGGRVRLKVLDFGIAKLVDASKSSVTPNAFATDAGVLFGTPRYVSPEQGLGRAIDERSDIYSVGLVLYRLLAGRGPFDDAGEGIHAIAAHIKRTPEPPSVSASQAIPAELDAIVLKALEKAPQDRYQSATEMADALRGERALAPYRAEPSGTLSGFSNTESDHGDPTSGTVIDPMTFEEDSYFAPRSLTEREATLILEDPTFDPFRNERTTHTAVPEARVPEKVSRYTLAVTLIVSAVIAGAVGLLLLEVLLR